VLPDDDESVSTLSKRRERQRCQVVDVKLTSNECCGCKERHRLDVRQGRVADDEAREARVMRCIRVEYRSIYTDADGQYDESEHAEDNETARLRITRIFGYQRLIHSSSAALNEGAQKKLGEKKVNNMSQSDNPVDIVYIPGAFPEGCGCCCYRCR